MFRAATIAALACLTGCEAHPRPRGQVTELGHVGKVQQLAVRGDWLYMTVMREVPAGDKPTMLGPVDIWRAPRSNGNAAKLATDLPPGVTAYADDVVYVAGADGSVTAVDLATGDAKPFAQLGTYLYAITVTADLVVVTTEREGVVRLRRPDGTRVPTSTGAAALGAIDRLATDGTRIAGSSIASGQVITVDVDGRVTPLGEPQNRPTCLGVTPTHTFWARDLDGHKSELVGIAHGGTAIDVIAALESSFPSCASWSEKIYVADERQLRVVVPGAAATKVAVTGWVPALTATEKGVYWVQMIASGWEIRFNRSPG